jgi:arsenate reductase
MPREADNTHKEGVLPTPSRAGFGASSQVQPDCFIAKQLAEKPQGRPTLSCHSRESGNPSLQPTGASGMTVTIYHNPSCSNSRQALAIIRERGIEPTIIAYLKTPLTTDQLRALIVKTGVPVKDVIRWKEAAVAEASIGETSSDDELLEAMAKHPILMNRPIVSTGKGVKLCRPGEVVAELL